MIPGYTPYGRLSSSHLNAMENYDTMRRNNQLAGEARARQAQTQAQMEGLINGLQQRMQRLFPQAFNPDPYSSMSSGQSSTNPLGGDPDIAALIAKSKQVEEAFYGPQDTVDQAYGGSPLSAANAMGRRAIGASGMVHPSSPSFAAPKQLEMAQGRTGRMHEVFNELLRRQNNYQTLSDQVALARGAHNSAMQQSMAAALSGWGNSLASAVGAIQAPWSDYRQVTNLGGGPNVQGFSNKFDLSQYNATPENHRAWEGLLDQTQRYRQQEAQTRTMEKMPQRGEVGNPRSNPKSTSGLAGGNSYN